MFATRGIAIAGAVFGLSASTGAWAQTSEPDTALASLIRANRHVLILDRDLGGPGAGFLDAHAAESDFVLVGESHGNRETPRIVDHLRNRLQGQGYGVFAVETGPVVTAAMVERLRSPNGVAALTEFARRYPFGFPFFQWREEAELLHRTVMDGWQVWGLDQEFVGGARFILDRLRELASRERAREVIATWRRHAERGYEAYVEGGDTDQAFMMTATAETFRELRAAFAEGPAEAMWMLDELEESAAVYQLYSSGQNYESNHRRIRLLKRHLADSLSAYRARVGRDAKVLLKFGSVHMGRGYSPLNQLDLGNQAAELGFARGRESFHLTIMAGTYETRTGRDVAALDQAPYLAPLLDVLDEDEWVVIDLSALRPYLHRRQNRQRHQDLTQLVFRYDAAIVGRRLRPSADLVPNGS